MKYRSLVLAASVLVVAGCLYRAPFADKQDIPLDPSVLGLWEGIPNEGEAPDPSNNRMVILKYTDTEYLVHCPTGPDGMYFRAFPIKIGDVSCVQVQEIGAAAGSISDGERRYHLVAYTLADGVLEVKTLNSELVDDDLRETAELKKAFSANEKNKDLFRFMRKFKKVDVKK